ncbi:hypothetical protein Tsubulata_023582 [Turnera subulata]|uniref:Uncharacterized protein n=1 Tax=Turnera subulata TaxID=218843 RepID=A0A9Q0G341_9ROSI|nr:hypothetical protein Tsubulata_023582 [Turnera subulata]
MEETRTPEMRRRMMGGRVGTGPLGINDEEYRVENLYAVKAAEENKTDPVTDDLTIPTATGGYQRQQMVELDPTSTFNWNEYLDLRLHNSPPLFLKSTRPRDWRLNRRRGEKGDLRGRFREKEMRWWAGGDYEWKMVVARGVGFGGGRLGVFR